MVISDQMNNDKQVTKSWDKNVLKEFPKLERSTQIWLKYAARRNKKPDQHMGLLSIRDINILLAWCHKNHYLNDQQVQIAWKAINN